MNVEYLGVLAGPDWSILIVVLLSLLGAAMLMLLAWASDSARNSVAVRLMPAPVALPHTRFGVEFHPRELARVPGETRAPPRNLPRQHAAATVRIGARC